MKVKASLTSKLVGFLEKIFKNKRVLKFAVKSENIIKNKEL